VRELTDQVICLVCAKQLVLRDHVENVIGVFNSPVLLDLPSFLVYKVVLVVGQVILQVLLRFFLALHLILFHFLDRVVVRNQHRSLTVFVHNLFETV